MTERVDKTVDRLNAFIKDIQQPKISIEQDERWANSLFIINFLAAGMAVVFGALAIPLRMSCRFDRNIGEAIVDNKYLLYGDRQTKLPLATIVRVASRTENRSQVGKLPFYINNKSVYSIHFILNTGKKVSLSVPSQNQTQYQEITDKINNFLHQH
ncbi:hypothetical protein [Chamaesiphon minutus]|uniref:hypothetical protein n=1 Tax=Chamaesiphon minutus TaxID=1173032 RepID=UPI0002F0B80D|nr:hypothetical protein [Chamaesiphon minutus]